MKRTTVGWLVVGLALQIGVPASMIATRERVLREGETLLLRTQPVDPFDAFRGRYVALRFDNALCTWTTNGTVPFVRGQKLWARYARDEQGLASLVELAARPTGDGVWLKVRATYITDETVEHPDDAQKESWDRRRTPTGRREVHFALPFDRFYLDEKLAPEAEQVARERQRSETNVVAAVRVLGRQAVLSDLLVGDRPIRDVVRDQE